MMRWELFGKAEKAAYLVARDEDIARDAALNALEECGEAPESHILRRARDRAKDIIRAARRAPHMTHQDMDTLPSVDCVVDEVARRQKCDRIAEAVGEGHHTILKAVDAGYSNAEIALLIGCSEETVRTRRKAAEAELETKGLA